MVTYTPCSFSSIKCSQGVVIFSTNFHIPTSTYTNKHTHAYTLLKQIVLDRDQRTQRLACTAGGRPGLSTPTSPPASAATATAAFPACLWRSRKKKRRRRDGEERARVRGREAQEEKKREGERDDEENRGPMPADAVELILCSIHCVMAASSCSSQSWHSCHL